MASVHSKPNYTRLPGSHTVSVGTVSHPRALPKWSPKAAVPGTKIVSTAPGLSYNKR